MKIEYIKVPFLNDNINIAVEKTIRIVDGKANETGKKKIIIIKPNSIEEGIFFI